jgi:DNA-binding CsgD family transcriptional regulator
LGQFAAFAGAAGAGLLIWDKAADLPVLLAASGRTGSGLHAYRRFAVLDPYRPLVASKPVGQWTASGDVHTDSSQTHNAFFTGYLAPRGIRHVAASRLVADAKLDIFLFIYRRSEQPSFARVELARLERISRFLEHALRTYVATVIARAAHDAGQAVLAHAAPPAVLVDERWNVLFASPAAEALLASDDVIGASDGRLTVRCDLAQRRLEALVAPAIGNRALLGRMLLERSSEQPPLTVFVAPAGPTATLSSLAPVRGALLLIHDPAHQAATLSKRLRAAFKLSGAEAALALGLLQGKRLAEIAAARRVSRETVRTQLRSLFRKTGTARQADVVRVLQMLE